MLIAESMKFILVTVMRQPEQQMKKLLTLHEQVTGELQFIGIL